MKHRILALVLAGMLTAAATACGSTNSKTSKNADAKPTVAYKDMQVGETATDLKADLKILTNRTDLVDSDFQDYISEFNAMYRTSQLPMKVLPITILMLQHGCLPVTGVTSAVFQLR